MDVELGVGFMRELNLGDGNGDMMNLVNDVTGKRVGCFLTCRCAQSKSFPLDH